MDPLPDDEIARAVAGALNWSLAADGKSISRDLEFPDFTTAFSFMTAVAIEAQALDHHPDWSNSYSSVSITLSTHAAGGLTDADFTLANRIDKHATTIS